MAAWRISSGCWGPLQFVSAILLGFTFVPSECNRSRPYHATDPEIAHSHLQSLPNPYCSPSGPSEVYERIATWCRMYVFAFQVCTSWGSISPLFSSSLAALPFAMIWPPSPPVYITPGHSRVLSGQISALLSDALTGPIVQYLEAAHVSRGVN